MQTILLGKKVTWKRSFDYFVVAVYLNGDGDVRLILQDRLGKLIVAGLVDVQVDL